jgi:hypothetical protein
MRKPRDENSNVLEVVGVVPDLKKLDSRGSSFLVFAVRLFFVSG